MRSGSSASGSYSRPARRMSSSRRVGLQPSRRVRPGRLLPLAPSMGLSRVRVAATRTLLTVGVCTSSTSSRRTHTSSRARSARSSCDPSSRRRALRAVVSSSWRVSRSSTSSPKSSRCTTTRSARCSRSAGRPNRASAWARRRSRRYSTILARMSRSISPSYGSIRYAYGLLRSSGWSSSCFKRRSTQEESRSSMRSSLSSLYYGRPSFCSSGIARTRS